MSNILPSILYQDGVESLGHSRLRISSHKGFVKGTEVTKRGPRHTMRSCLFLTGNCYRALAITTLVLILIAPTSVQARKDNASNEPGLADHASAYVKDYLSDNRRVGAVVGSILGGALTAHPAGTVLGSIVGFFIGKQTMFDEDGKTALQSRAEYARRDIVPSDSMALGAPTLSFSNPTPLVFDVPPIAAAPSTTFVAQAETPSLSPSVPSLSPEAGIVSLQSAKAQAVIPVSPALLQPTLPQRAGLSREQISAMCRAGSQPHDTRLKSLCFYFQGG